MPVGICVLTGSAGVAGTVVFTTEGASTHVTGEITGLAPGQHGFHVHQVRPAASVGGLLLRSAIRAPSLARPSYNPGCSPTTPLEGCVLTRVTLRAAGRHHQRLHVHRSPLQPGGQDPRRPG